MSPSVRNMLLLSTAVSSALVDELEEIPDISTKYDLLSTANKEVALEKIPKRRKTSDLISDRGEVQTAGCVPKKSSEAHYICPTGVT